MSNRSLRPSLQLGVRGAAALAAFATVASAGDLQVAVQDSAGFLLTDATVARGSAAVQPTKPDIGVDGTAVFVDVADKITLQVEHPAYGRFVLPVDLLGDESALVRVTLTPGGATAKIAPTTGLHGGTGTGSAASSCATALGCQIPDGAGHGGSSTLAATSDRGPLGLRQADAFTALADGVLSDVCWWGGYLDFATMSEGAPGLDDFQITYYADDQGSAQPGAILAGPFPVSPVISVTGASLCGGNTCIAEYHYEAQHPPVPVAAGSTYWIEVTNQASGSLWLWSTAPGDGLSAQQGNSVWSNSGHDLAFCLDLPVGLPTYSAGPPGSNDQCSSAEAIAGEGLFAFDNTTATTDGLSDGLCFAFGEDQIENDVWFCWTAPGTGLYDVQTCGLTAVDTRLAVYDGCSCPTGTGGILACNDDTCALQSLVTISATAGNTYLIRVGTFPGAAGGTGQLSIAAQVPPASDDCSGATAISGAGLFNFDNTFATTDGLPDALCDAFGETQIDSDVWFCWTAPATDTFQVETCGLTAVDTRIAVYDGCACPTGTGGILACNDDSCALQSSLTFPATAGNSYLIRVGTFPGAPGGTGQLSIAPFAIPANDLCQDAVAVGVPSTTPGSTNNATIDTGVPFCGTSVTSPGVWYTVSGTGNTLTASLCNGVATFDSKLSVFCAGDCSDLPSLSCVTGIDDFCGVQSEVSWCSQAGATYLILVHGFGGDTGVFDLVLSDDGVACTATVNCLPTGACCTPSGCVVTTSGDCASQGGIYQGDGTDCGDFGYTAMDCSNQPYVGIANTAGATQVFLGDDDQTTVPIGFPFEFFGNTYTNVTIGSNGYLTFGPDGSEFSNVAIPDPAVPNDIIAPMWDDLDPSSGGSIWYKNFGPLGQRAFVVEWNGVPQFAGTDANTFEAVLFSSSEVIDFRYAAVTPEAFPGDYTVGVESADGTSGTSVPGSNLGAGYCTAFVPNVVIDPCNGTAALDLAPGQCTNFHVATSDGLVRATLAGSALLDVSTVNTSALHLSLLGGGRAVLPLQDGYGPAVQLVDVTTPGQACDLILPDGVLDLQLQFSSEVLADAFDLESIPSGTDLDLRLTGELADGTVFWGADTLSLSNWSNGGATLNVKSNLAGAFVWVDTPDDNWTSGGFSNFEREYALGSEITLLVATGGPAPRFLGWMMNGQNVGTEPILVHTLEGDTNVWALFDVRTQPWGSLVQDQ